MKPGDEPAVAAEGKEGASGNESASASGSGRVSVTVKTIRDEVVFVGSFSSDDRVSSLRTSVEEKLPPMNTTSSSPSTTSASSEPSPAPTVKLVHAGSMLADSATLAESGIHDGAVLRVAMSKLRISSSSKPPSTNTSNDSGPTNTTPQRHASVTAIFPKQGSITGGLMLCRCYGLLLFLPDSYQKTSLKSLHLNIPLESYHSRSASTAGLILLPTGTSSHFLNPPHLG
ncbi:hypothetical protein Pelo_4826 [Pelomyxa schiedti]|nr:hypothetical protein Pelo_4826 [Pelomyxa schiedti]